MSEPYADATIAWAEQWDKCWCCGDRGFWPRTLFMHHFCRGSSRGKNNLATTAILCFYCHFEEHEGRALGLLGMLALKLRYDPDHYNLAEVNRVRGRAPGAITQREVEEAV